jgi:hypothetical protein
VCDEAGRCAWSEPRDCFPFACGDGACAPACGSAADCAAGAFCDEGAGQCLALREDGEACGGDGACRSGHCQGGWCCREGVCCAGDEDCGGGAGGDGAPVCLWPLTCQSLRAVSFCTEEHRCAPEVVVEDDRGCTAEVVQSCGWYADHACDGAPDQPAFACATGCAGDAECDPDAGCRAGRCVPREDYAHPCASDAECGGDHCGDGFCCPAGECCAVTADCDPAAAAPPVCDNPARCQGFAVHVACDERAMCQARPDDDDSACGPGEGPDCGAYRGPRCDGSADQPFAACPAGCDDDAGCVEGFRCVRGACRASAPDAGALDAGSDAGPDAGGGADASADGGGRDLAAADTPPDAPPDSLAPGDASAADVADGGPGGGGGGCAQGAGGVSGPAAPLGVLLLAGFAAGAQRRRRARRRGC